MCTAHKIFPPFSVSKRIASYYKIENLLLSSSLSCHHWSSSWQGVQHRRLRTYEQHTPRTPAMRNKCPRDTVCWWSSARVMQEEELRPPLSQSEYPLPRNESIAAPFQAIISTLQCKLYISTHALQLSTETRFATMVLFHRFICRYFKSIEPCTNSGNEMLTIQQKMDY